MDKPISLSVKDWIIRNLSGKMMISERIIEAVINTQFEQAYEAMKTQETLEFSGFGKLIFNKRKAFIKMEKYKRIKAAYEKQLLSPITEQKRKNTEIRLKNLERDIELLNIKLQHE
jgi:nucleoid DNA-binding protein